MIGNKILLILVLVPVLIFQSSIITAKTSGAYLAPQFNENKFDGFVFENVKTNSIYNKGGVKNGDKLIKIENNPVIKLAQVLNMLNSITKHNKSFTITVKRNNKLIQLELGK